MSAYLPPKHINETFNSADYNYQNNFLTYGQAYSLFTSLNSSSDITALNILVSGKVVVSSTPTLINCPSQSIFISGNVDVEGTINQSVNIATATGVPISSTTFVYYTSTNSPVSGFFVRPTTGITGGDYQIVNTVDFVNHIFTVSGPSMTVPSPAVNTSGYINTSGALVVLSPSGLSANQIFTNISNTNVSYIVSITSAGVISAGRIFTATAAAQTLTGYITNVGVNYYLITNTAIPTTNNFISGAGVLPSSYVQGSTINGNSYQINSLTTITPPIASTSISGFPISSTQISYQGYTGVNPTSASGYFVGASWDNGTTTAAYGVVISGTPTASLITTSSPIANYNSFTKTSTQGIVLSATSFAVFSTTGFTITYGLVATNNKLSFTNPYIATANASTNVLTTTGLTPSSFANVNGYIKTGGTNLVIQSGSSISTGNSAYSNNGTAVILPVQVPTLSSGQNYTITGGTATTATTTFNAWFPTTTTLVSQYTFASTLLLSGTGIADGAYNTTSATNQPTITGGLTASTARTSTPNIQFIFDGSNYYAYWPSNTVPQATDFVVHSTNAPQASAIQLGTIVNTSSSLVSYKTAPTTGVSRFSASTNQGINFYFLTSNSIVLSTGSALGQINANPSTFGLTSTDICWFGGNYGTRVGFNTPVYLTYSYTANITTVISFSNLPNFTPTSIYSTGTMGAVSGSSNITYTTSGAKPLVGQFFNPASGSYVLSGIVITAIAGAASPYTITLSSAITQGAVAVQFARSESSSTTGGFSMIASANMLSTASYYPSTSVSLYSPISIYNDVATTFTCIMPQILRFYAPTTYSTFTPTTYSFYTPSTTATFYTYDSFSLPIPNNGSTSDTLVSNSSTSTLSNKTLLNTVSTSTITASTTITSPYSYLYEIVSVSGLTITLPSPTASIVGLVIIFRRKSNITSAVSFSLASGTLFPSNSITGITTGTLLSATAYQTMLICDSATSWVQLFTQ